MVLAIDFDGTIVKHAFPAIGPFRKNAVNVLKKLYDDGHKIIIWTCRTEDEHINPAKEVLETAGIRYHAFNANIDPARFNPLPKIYADLYIDDRGLFGIPDDWEAIYNIIKMKRFVG